MSNKDCAFTGDREATVIGYLYGEIDQPEKAAFESHLAACAVCRHEIAELRAARLPLEKWQPPELAGILSGPVRSSRPRPWWSEVPPWAQAAAALLFLGVAAGAANLRVSYGRDGLTVTTGWRTPPSNTGFLSSRGRTQGTARNRAGLFTQIPQLRRRRGSQTPPQ